MPVSNTERGIYLTLSYGKFRKKVDKDTPGAVQRKNKNDKIVYELTYDTVIGTVTKINRMKQEEYGWQYHFHLRDSQEEFILSVSAGTNANKLINKLINSKANQEVKIVAYHFPDEDKTAFNVFQDGEKIPAHYSKDNPGDMPTTSKPWKEMDDREQTNFIFDLDEFFQKKIEMWAKAIDILSAEPDLEPQAQENEPAVPEDEDDLPF